MRIFKFFNVLLTSLQRFMAAPKGVQGACPLSALRAVIPDLIGDPGQKCATRTILAILALVCCSLSAHAQTHSQFFDYIGLNTYWNGTAWASYAPGYSNMLTTDTATGNFILSTGGNAASAGLAGTMVPVMTVTPAGTVSATAFVGDGSGLTNLAASSVSVADGLSGSLVFRDGTGVLHGHPSISVSSTTGSVGIGAGAPAWVTGGLYTNGIIATANKIYAGSGIVMNSTGPMDILWDGYTDTAIRGDYTNKYIAFRTSDTEAMRIVSSGFVGIGNNTPKANL